MLRVISVYIYISKFTFSCCIHWINLVVIVYPRNWLACSIMLRRLYTKYRLCLIWLVLLIGPLFIDENSKVVVLSSLIDGSCTMRCKLPPVSPLQHYHRVLDVHWKLFPGTTFYQLLSVVIASLYLLWNAWCVWGQWREVPRHQQLQNCHKAFNVELKSFPGVP